MGIHPFPMVVETQPDALTEARRDMWLWAEPIIADCAAEWYARTSPDGLAASVMARKHCRLWRSVIHDQPASIPEISEDLRRAGQKFGLRPNFIEQVNAAVLEELVDVVLRRFRASRTATRTFSLVLMSATSCFGTARAAA